MFFHLSCNVLALIVAIFLAYHREIREAREELAALIESQLREYTCRSMAESDFMTDLYILGDVTGNTHALMWWSHRAYWEEIVLGYRVAVFGWPEDIKFAGPFQLPSSLNLISRLRFGWRKRQIYFRKLTEAEFVEKENELKPLAEADRVASRLCRNQRSDLGDRRQLRPVETRGKRRRAKSGLHSARYVGELEDTVE